MQFTATRYLKSIGRSRFFYTQADIGLHFAEKSVSQMTARNKIAFLTGKGTVVNIKNHGQCRFVNIDFRQSFGIRRIGNGFTDFYIGNADDAGNIPHRGPVFPFYTIQAFIRIHSGNFSLSLALTVDEKHVLIRFHTAANDSTDSDFTDIIIVVQGSNHELQRSFQIALRARAVVDNRLK